MNLKKQIQELVDYLDRRIKRKDATEPNAYTVRLMLNNILKGKNIWGEEIEGIAGKTNK